MENKCKICIYKEGSFCTSHGVKVPIVSELFSAAEPCPSFTPRYSIIAYDEDGEELLLPLTSL